MAEQRQPVRASPRGQLRPARGFALGLLLSTPLWILLALVARSIFPWFR